VDGDDVDGEREGSGSPRSRALTWGDPAARDAVFLLAADVRSRAGFATCAIEVLRADGMLEFVAIADTRGNDEQWVGRARPLTAVRQALALGADYGRITFVAAEWFTPEASAALDPYAVIPDLPPSADPDRWQAHDMLVARITDDRGALCGLLFLDEPLSGRRLSDVQLAQLSHNLALPLRAVLTAFEREAFSHRARLADAARDAVHGLSRRTGVAAFVEAARPHLERGLRASTLGVRLFDASGVAYGDAMDGCPPDLVSVLDASARRAWRDRGVVIVEPHAVWGDDELEPEVARRLSAHLADCGAATMVCLPLGDADEPVGHLLVVRDQMRWTEAESQAAQAVGHDVGRAIRLARSFEREAELVAELRRVDAERSEFARTVSHELKNPLAVVSANVELLQLVADEDERQRMLAAIDRGVGRLEQLLDDLGTLSRAGSSPGQATGTPVDVTGLVTDLAEATHAMAEVDGIKLVCSADDDLWVQGDAQDLAAAFGNVVGNAVKYSDRGGLVLLELISDGGEVRFSCSDQGIGISPEDQSRLFTDFFRSTNPGALQRPGTGLGLVIVRRIVERHGGSVAVDSELGVGTSVTVTLPAFAPS